MAKQVLIALMVVAAGCMHRSADPNSVPTVSCGTRRLAVVINDWSEPVEVFTRIGMNPTRQYLGTVAPGARGQFQLPETARDALVDAQNATGRTRTNGLNMVTVRYLCD